MNKIKLFLFLYCCYLPIATQAKENITVRGVSDFYQICQSIFTDFTKTKSEKYLMVWVIDLSGGIESEIEALKGEVCTLFNSKNFHMAIVTMEKEIKVALPATNSPDKVIRVLENLSLQKGIAKTKNVLAAIRRASQNFHEFQGAKSIVYFSLQNADNEDNLERTLSILKKREARFYAITRESAFADCWALKNNVNSKVKGFSIYGQESPYEENLWGWLSILGYKINGDKQDNFFPSGFGFFALGRLAHATNGLYFLYHPKTITVNKSKPHPLFLYNPNILSLYHPTWVSRKKYLQNLRKKPLHKSLFHCWNLLSAKGGIVSKSSPFTKQLTKTRPNRSTSITGIASSFDSISKVRSAQKVVSNKMRTVNSAMKYLRKTLKRFKRPVHEIPKTGTFRRDYAHLELLYLQMHKVRFHLQQYYYALSSIKRGMFKRKGSVSIKSEELFNFTQKLDLAYKKEFKSDSTGKRLHKNLLLQMEDFIKKYRGTPWVVIAINGYMLNFKAKHHKWVKPKKQKKKKKKKIKKKKIKKPKEKKKKTPKPAPKPSIPQRPTLQSSGLQGTQSSGD